MVVLAELAAFAALVEEEWDVAVPNGEHLLPFATFSLFASRCERTAAPHDAHADLASALRPVSVDSELGSPGED